MHPRAPRRLGALLTQHGQRLLGLGRRGTTSLVFAAITISLLGFVSMGTEGGLWYVLKRRGQNAADAAAAAGALAIAWENAKTSGGQPHAAAIAGATDAAIKNGFTAGGSVTVTINNPPASGAYTTNSGAVEVLITQTQAALISAVFYKNNIVIGSRAVGLVQSVGNACVLALSGSLSLGGHSTTTGSGCVLASNNTGPQSIYIYGSASVSATSLSAAGTCSGCAGSSVTLSQPAKSYQLPTSDPFNPANTAIQGYSFSSCVNQPGGTSFSLVPYETSRAAYCSLSMTSGTGSVTLTPGTYFFAGSGGVTVHGGTLTCPTCTGTAGVTIVMTGLNGNGNAGGLDLNGNGTINLQAPVTNATNSAFNGLLFYQDYRGSPGNDSINGTTNDIFNGGMYFPAAVVTINGTAGVGTTCTQLVAGTIDASGNADSTFDISGCSRYGTAVPQIQAVRLIE